MNRRTFLARVGIATAAAAVPFQRLAQRGLEKAVDAYRSLGMRVDPNARLDYPYPGVTHSIWAPFRDAGGGLSHQLIGFLDRAGRFITDANYYQGLR